MVILCGAIKLSNYLAVAFHTLKRLLIPSSATAKVAKVVVQVLLVVMRNVL